MKKILIADDYYGTMINGVSTVIDNISKNLKKRDYIVDVVYPKILPDLKIDNNKNYIESEVLYNKVKEADYIHLISEAPFDFFVQKYCKELNKKYTTSMYTKFPEYHEIWSKIKKIKNIDIETVSKEEYQEKLIEFHKHSSRVMVPTNDMTEYAKKLGINNIIIWTIGVDTDIFKPIDYNSNRDYISCVYYGRVTVEKNIDEFLKIDDPKIKKTIIGPKAWGYTKELLYSFPNVISVIGKINPEQAAIELPKHDVLVFPSQTDTFGLVMLEAMACGLPIAAFPNKVVNEVIENGVTGIMNISLKNAIYKASKLDRQECIKRANKFSWDSATDQFLNFLVESK